MNELKKCPFCEKDIQQAAVKCKHCGGFLSSVKREDIINAEKANKKKNIFIKTITFLFSFIKDNWFKMILLCIVAYLAFNYVLLNRYYFIDGNSNYVKRCDYISGECKKLRIDY